MHHLLAVVMTVMFAIGSSVAFAQPDKGHGKGQGQGNQNQGQGNQGQGNQGQGNQGNQGGGQQGGPSSPQARVSISDRDRNEVYSYYRTQYAAGHCPPGLAKKNNGCMPPGQAKKVWAMNQPLPGGVVYEVLPRDLLGRLSPAPSGYQYVRVANDVLMMAVGTRLIVGALADLGAM